MVKIEKVILDDSLLETFRIFSLMLALENPPKLTLEWVKGMKLRK